MTRAFFVLLALLIAIPQAEAVAQTTPVDDSGVADGKEVGELRKFEASLSVTRDFGGEPLDMHLSEAVARGIENNLQLQVERFDPLISFESQEGSWGAFDPTFSMDGGYSSQYEPNTSILIGGAVGGLRNTTRRTDGTAGVDTLVPWLGASLGLEFASDKTETSQFSTFATIKPVYQSSAMITGTIPLLKGLIWNEPWTRVKTAQSQYGGSRENFRRDLMDVVQFIETSYWDVVAQKQAVRVAEKSLETALSLLDQTKTQYEVGVKSKVEVVESEAGVASREFDLIRAINLYRRAQDDLIDAVLGTQLTPASRIEIIPADDPENYVTYQIDITEATGKAFRNRPELKEAEYEIERQEFELKFAKNQRLPQLDIQGSYGVGGIRGSDAGLVVRDSAGLPVLDPVTGLPIPVRSSFTGNYGDTFGDWFTDKSGEDFSVRAVVSIPLGNVGARHRVSRQQLELRKFKTRLVRLRQNIILEVRDSTRNLESAQEGIEAADRRQIAAAEQLRAERVRLEYGESTPFRVLEREEDLVEAENEKIGALFTYRKSVVDLHRAQGTILTTRNIVVEEAAVLR